MKDLQQKNTIFIFVKLALSGYFILTILLLLLYGYNFKLNAGDIVQPVNFSHKKHALENGIECTFCHFNADKSPRADVPSVQKCMDCHSSIATEKPEIQKLTNYWEKKEAIPWLRVYSLPDHVYFSHKRHIKRGIDCVVCHGDVKNMKRIRKMRSLKMGWCVGCHRRFGGSEDCLTCHK